MPTTPNHERSSPAGGELAIFDLRWAFAAIVLCAIRVLMRTIDDPIGSWLMQLMIQLALGSAALAIAGGIGGSLARQRLGWVTSRLSWHKQVVAVVAGLLLIILLTTLFAGPPATPPERPFSNVYVGHVGLFVSLVMLPAVMEETLFRGALLTLLARHCGAAVAIVASAGLFAILHTGAGPHATAFAFMLGLCLGILTHTSGSIREAMLIHALNNGAYFVAWLV
jgi:membrane protease YdiL (CAAX protease family)